MLVLCGLVLVSAPTSSFAFETWTERRDRGVVRQSRDFSCGLAALATVLSAWGERVSEAELLDELLDERPRQAPSGHPNGAGEAPRISFADLARLARRHGFLARGADLPTASLPHLRSPAIVAMKIDGQAHFSVLRAVNQDGVALLADPSWGHRRLAAWRFQRYAAAAADYGRARLLLVARSTEPPPDGLSSAGDDWQWPAYLWPAHLRPAPTRSMYSQFPRP